MGLSDIAKAPVSHGVEPHDLETGRAFRLSLLARPLRPSPPLPRERFSPRADTCPSLATSEGPLSAQIEASKPAVCYVRNTPARRGLARPGWGAPIRRVKTGVVQTTRARATGAALKSEQTFRERSFADALARLHGRHGHDLNHRGGVSGDQVDPAVGHGGGFMTTKPGEVARVSAPGFDLLPV